MSHGFFSLKDIQISKEFNMIRLDYHLHLFVVSLQCHLET